jgi:hypothetical protein
LQHRLLHTFLQLEPPQTYHVACREHGGSSRMHAPANAGSLPPLLFQQPHSSHHGQPARSNKTTQNTLSQPDTQTCRDQSPKHTINKHILKNLQTQRPPPLTTLLHPITHHTHCLPPSTYVADQTTRFNASHSYAKGPITLSQVNMRTQRMACHIPYYAATPFCKAQQGGLAPWHNL